MCTYIVVLPLLSLLQVVLLSLEPDNGLPQLGGLALELVVVHGVEVEGLDADGQGDLLLLFQLLLGLGHLTASVLDIAHLQSVIWIVSISLKGWVGVSSFVQYVIVKKVVA